MQLPPILQGDSLTRLLQGAAVGAVATMVIGFTWGGWTLGSTAKQMSEQKISAALVAVLAPMCVDKFRRGPDAAGQMVEFKKVSSWMQRLLHPEGWLGDVPRHERARPRHRPGVRQVIDADAVALNSVGDRSNRLRTSCRLPNPGGPAAPR